MNESADIIIVGGGIMGSALAYSLMKADQRLTVTVVEKDPTYTRASTALSMSNARIQFSLERNIQISRYTLDVLENFAEEMQVEDNRPAICFRQEGNLFLFDANGHKAAKTAFELQKSLGCQVQWWDAQTVKSHYPLYETAPYAGGTFGSRDGHFDAHAMLSGYKAKARSMGAVFIHDTVMEILTRKRSVHGVQLASGSRITADYVVNCAGAWCTQVASTAGVHLPVQPVKRQVFALDTAVKPDAPLPLTVLPSGLYFRSETGGMILLGKSMNEDPVGFDFTWDDKRFMEILWPELADFVPAFDRLKLLRGWAGLYAVNTLDGNAILGQWPELDGFYLANGFSGHGLQQAPAVGRYLAECILELPHALDLSVFSPQRIIDNQPLSEGGLV